MVKMQKTPPHQEVDENISFLIAKLMKWKDLREKYFYKKPWYIPDINLGMTVEKVQLLHVQKNRPDIRQIPDTMIYVHEAKDYIWLTKNTLLKISCFVFL